MVSPLFAATEPVRVAPASLMLIARRTVLRAGLGLGTASLLAIPRPASAATQTGWRFCTKCRGLFGEGSAGATRRKKKKKGKRRRAAQ